ncbi:LacI family transcriptional regulator [Treponema zuelzerae]|uniref:LacI family transcriptional regulator n=1 Tax=Teretinema zuelzerae TaxID=156 RepID=A0AAE3JID7_9SPIR|nr:LacI family DNA-binding transcriptional regulator [Teretinema zuelzerae]MCD1654041.1 LacI family transcriptional regulator [Teretinema zuelzerae]
MAVTIHDVAKAAGVSHTTVSWTIHGHPGITEETKARVLKAIEELDYHPNYLARSLVSGKTHTIAVVASFFSSPYEMEVMKGIEQAIVETPSGYLITLYSTLNEDERVLKEIVHGRRADAAIALSICPSEETVALYQKNKIPLVVIDENAPGTLGIQLDNFQGGYAGTEHLLSRGRKKPGLVIGSVGEYYHLSQRERKRGFIQALVERNISYDPSMILSIENYYFEEGKAVLDKALELGMDSLFCAAGDEVAMGILFAAKNRGLDIPSELSLVGYDDISGAALVTPALTTVNQPLSHIGKCAYQETLALLKSCVFEEKTILYKPKLIVRASS